MSAATPSRSTCIACARSSSPSASTSAPCGEWATFSTSSMSERRTTLRGKLLRWLLIPMSVLFLLDAAGSYVLASRLADRVYDGELMEIARELVLHVKRDGAKIGFDLEADAERTLLLDQYDKVYYAVRGPDRALIAGDADLREQGPASSAAAFYDAEIGGD